MVQSSLRDKDRVFQFRSCQVSSTGYPPEILKSTPLGTSPAVARIPRPGESCEPHQLPSRTFTMVRLGRLKAGEREPPYSLQALVWLPSPDAGSWRLGRWEPTPRSDPTSVRPAWDSLGTRSDTQVRNAMLGSLASLSPFRQRLPTHAADRCILCCRDRVPKSF